MNPTYLQEIELSEETLAHYGVLGMKWGVRHDPERKGNGSASRKKQYKSKKGGFTRNSAYRVGSTVTNIAENWGNSAARGKKLVKEGNTEKYGYFDSKKDTGYLKALLRGSAREIQMSVASIPVVALSAGLAANHPIASDAVRTILRHAYAVGSTANAVRTLSDISNTRDVRNYKRQERKSGK